MFLFFKAERQTTAFTYILSQCHLQQILQRNFLVLVLIQSLKTIFSNASDPILPTRYNEASELEVENKGEKDIKNPGLYLFYPKKVYNIYYLYLISIMFDYGIML